MLEIVLKEKIPALVHAAKLREFKNEDDIADFSNVVCWEVWRSSQKYKSCSDIQAGAWLNSLIVTQGKKFHALVDPENQSLKDAAKKAATHKEFEEVEKQFSGPDWTNEEGLSKNLRYEQRLVWGVNADNERQQRKRDKEADAIEFAKEVAPRRKNACAEILAAKVEAMGQEGYSKEAIYLVCVVMASQSEEGVLNVGGWFKDLNAKRLADTLALLYPLKKVLPTPVSHQVCVWKWNRAKERRI